MNEVEQRRRFKIVFDDLEAAAAKSPNPVIAKLTFGLVFVAPTPEEAKKIAAEAMSFGGKLGSFHVEEVRDG